MVPRVPLRKPGRALPSPRWWRGLGRGPPACLDLSFLFRFFHSNSDLPPTLVLFPGSERLGTERARERLPAGIGANTQSKRRDFRVIPEVTRQSRSPPGGTAGGCRCRPGPGPAVGPTLSVSDRSGSQGSGDRGADSGIRALRPGLGSFSVPSKNHLPAFQP